MGLILGEYGFKCDQCDKSFNRKTRLDTHKKYFHEGAEPMKCEQCDRQFIRKEDLARHNLTHTGVKGLFYFPFHSCSFYKHIIKLPFDIFLFQLLLAKFAKRASQ